MIIGGMTITAERNLKMNFTNPYYYTGQGLLANRKMTEGFAIADFNKPEVTLAARLGSTAALAARAHFPKATLRLFDNEPAAVQEVRNGRVHGMVSNEPLPVHSAAAAPELLKAYPEQLVKEPIAMGVRKGDADTLNFLNNWIEVTRSQGLDRRALRLLVRHHRLAAAGAVSRGWQPLPRPAASPPSPCVPDSAPLAGSTRRCSPCSWARPGTRATASLSISTTPWNWAAMPQFLFRYDADEGRWVANYLVEGLLTTLRLSVWSGLLALVLGLAMALARTGRNLYWRLVARSYVELMRNLPPLVVIFLFYFFLADQLIPLWLAPMPGYWPAADPSVEPGWAPFAPRGQRPPSSPRWSPWPCSRAPMWPRSSAAASNPSTARNGTRPTPSG